MLGERVDHAHDRRAVGRRRHPDTQAARDGACAFRCCLEDSHQLRVGRSKLGVQPHSERGQRYAAAGAFEQPSAELGFQRLDGLADPGGGDEESFGGAPVVEFLGEGEEHADLAQLH